MRWVNYSVTLTDLDLLSRREVRLVLLVAAYVACGWAASQRWQHARAEFINRPHKGPDHQRADGGSGHAEIDFGGQYVHGRMVVEGHARSLYDRRRQWEIVRAAYPAAGGSPAQRDGREPSDAANMMFWFVGGDPPAGEEPTEPVIGGPLYPPVHALLYAPLAILPAADAYAAFQTASVGLVLLSAVGLAWLAGAVRWWPAVAVVLFLFPGQMSGLDLGQNQALTLALLVGGWVLRTRNYPVAAGLVWGCLAFKPVWAVAFLLVPVALREWRFLLGMVAGGGGWVLLTLPVTGLQVWFDWLAVGRLASAEYEINQNWTELSRDVGGLFRRLLVDFRVRPVTPSPLAAWLNLLAVAAVVAGTLLVAVRRVPRHTRDLSACGFVLLGGYLACFRFAYYDAVVAALPAVLLAAARERWRPVAVTLDGGGASVRAVAPSVTLSLVALLAGWEVFLRGMVLGVTVAFGALGGRSDRVAAMPTGAPTLSADTTVYTAGDTIILVVLWAWAGLRLWLGGYARSAASAAPGSGARTSDSPTSTA